MVGANRKQARQAAVTLVAQSSNGVQIRVWNRSFPNVALPDVVVEAFGCGLPDSYIQAMAASSRPPIWINLEYLSAEPWVESAHGLPSPQPRLPLTRYFYFPGFTARTGGNVPHARQSLTRGRLTLATLPFVTQDDYDRLLWHCDVNIVRGEDSFVRAQWAAQPFVWHIYPQADDAHRVKLEEFLRRFEVGLEDGIADIVS